MRETASAGAHAGRRELRRGHRGLRRGDPGPDGPAARPRGERAEHPGLRRLGLHRHRGGPAVRALRRGRHRGVRPPEPGPGAVPRCRPGHRLHAGGLHGQRAGLGRHLRRGGQAVVPPLPELPAPRRHLPGHRPPEQRAPVLVDPVRGQEGGVPDPAPLHPAGRGVPQGPDRGRPLPARHRPHLPAGQRGRGHPLRRDRAEDRKRRPDGALKAAPGSRRGPARGGRTPGRQQRRAPRRSARAVRGPHCAWCPRRTAPGAPTTAARRRSAAADHRCRSRRRWRRRAPVPVRPASPGRGWPAPGCSRSSARTRGWTARSSRRPWPPARRSHGGSRPAGSHRALGT